MDLRAHNGQRAVVNRFWRIPTDSGGFSNGFRLNPPHFQTDSDGFRRILKRIPPESAALPDGFRRIPADSDGFRRIPTDSGGFGNGFLQGFHQISTDAITFHQFVVIAIAVAPKLAAVIINAVFEPKILSFSMERTQATNIKLQNANVSCDWLACGRGVVCSLLDCSFCAGQSSQTRQCGKVCVPGWPVGHMQLFCCVVWC